MKLYLITQDQFKMEDACDGMVVCAKNRDKAMLFVGRDFATDQNKITCEEIGTANKQQEPGVILISYIGR